MKIPAYCPHCDSFFESVSVALSGGSKVSFLNCKTNCPVCGKSADLIDGVYSVTENILSVIGTTAKSKELLQKLYIILDEGRRQKITVDELQKKIAVINPDVAEKFELLKGNPSLSIAVIMLLIFAIKSCNFDVKINVNELLNQYQEKHAVQIIRR